MDTGGDPPAARYECQANEFAKLTASDAAASDYFGNSVSISGDWGLVCLAYNFKRLFSLQTA